MKRLIGLVVLSALLLSALACTREVEKIVVVTPTELPATATAQPPATPPTPLPDRTDCAEIKGTDYHSSTEREWYLANCVPTPVAPEAQAPSPSPLSPSPLSPPPSPPLPPPAPTAAPTPNLAPISLTFTSTRPPGSFTGSPFPTAKVYFFIVSGFDLDAVRLQLSVGLSGPSGPVADDFHLWQWVEGAPSAIALFLFPVLPAGDYTVSIRLPDGRTTSAAFTHVPE